MRMTTKSDGSEYIHGTSSEEQTRLRQFNGLNNPSFIEGLPLSDRASVLEVGCGLGILADQVARTIPHGTVTAIDHSVEQLANLASHSPNIQILRADAYQLPFDDDHFDVVYCRWLLEHLQKPVAVLQEMRRVLKPGGFILVEENDISVQRYDPDCPKFELVWEKFAQLQTQLGGDAYIGRRLTPMFIDAGFHDVELRLRPMIFSAQDPGLRSWIENEIGIIKVCTGRLTQDGYLTASEIEASIQELQNLMKNPRATSWFYFNQALAQK